MLSSSLRNVSFGFDCGVGLVLRFLLAQSIRAVLHEYIHVWLEVLPAPFLMGTPVLIQTGASCQVLRATWAWGEHVQSAVLHGHSVHSQTRPTSTGLEAKTQCQQVEAHQGREALVRETRQELVSLGKACW